MARANQAYSRGDIETLQRLLDDHLEIDASIAGEGAAAELLRITRQIQHAERDIATLEAERHTLLSGEIAQLHLDAEAAACQNIVTFLPSLRRVSASRSPMRATASSLWNAR